MLWLNDGDADQSSDGEVEKKLRRRHTASTSNNNEPTPTDGPSEYVNNKLNVRKWLHIYMKFRTLFSIERDVPESRKRLLHDPHKERCWNCMTLHLLTIFIITCQRPGKMQTKTKSSPCRRQLCYKDIGNYRQVAN